MPTLMKIIVIVGLYVAGAFTVSHHTQPPSPTATTPAAVSAPAPRVTPAPVQAPVQAPQGQPEGYTCWTEHHAEDGGWDERLCRRDAPPAPAPTPYTCTSPSSCAVLAAALGGSSAQPQASPRQHRQPRTHTTQRSSGPAWNEDSPNWNCARHGNHVCGDGVAGGPTASGRCPAGGTRVHGTPHGCRYR